MVGGDQEPGSNRARRRGPPSYLARGSGQAPGDHGRVGDLHRQELVVDEGPGALHPAGLELVAEGAQVGIPEEAAVGVVVLRGVPGDAALVVAHLGPVGALLAVRGRRLGRRRWGGRVGPGRRGGALLGAVVLAHEVLDAVLRRVVRQVAAAGAGRPPHAAVVRPQRRAELLLPGRVGGGGPEVRVALEDLALQAGCGGGRGGGQEPLETRTRAPVHRAKERELETDFVL